MKNRIASQRGEGNLGCFLWLIVLILCGLILWKAVPVKVANVELYDYMEELTKFASGRPEGELKRMILRKAQELELPVTSKQIYVEKSRERIILRCSYTVQLEFPGYTYDWKVNHEVDRAIFFL